MIDELEHIVVECGHLVIGMQGGSDIEAQDKDEPLGNHFSTRADRASLAHGLKRFAEVFPGETIIAEEQENLYVPKDCIVFDPLDGTTNFYNGLPDFGVTACVIRDHVTTCGATYFASSGLVVSAVRGEGCFEVRDGVRTRITNISWHRQLDKTIMGTDVGSWVHTKDTFEKVLKPLSKRFCVLSSMCAVMEISRVLFGHIGAYYNIGSAKIWDAAAMTLAVEEAGGVVCAPDGASLRWNTLSCDWIVAANSTLADIVVGYTKSF